MPKNDKEKELPVLDISSEPFGGMPETAFEMVNRYGTYEIQATADTENLLQNVLKPQMPPLS